MLQVRRFLHSRDGAISAMFAIVLVAILGIAGAGFDLAQAFRARAALQGAVDGAALAAGADTTNDKAKMRDLGEEYLKSNAPAAALVKMGELTTSYDGETKTISASLTGTVPTSLMGLVGVPSIAIKVNTQVKRAEPGPLELVLAVDTTASMNETAGAERKIIALRKAAIDLVDTVMASPHAKVGVVPFSAGVRVSTSYKDKNWVFPKPDTTTESCSTETLVPGIGYACTTTSDSCTRDGIATTCTATSCTWEVPPVVSTTCTPAVSSWNGCLSVRKNFEDTIESPANPKYPWTGNMCAQEMMDLSDSKTALTTKINGLAPALDTYIPFGLVWAWNMLTPDEPLTSASSKGDIAESGGKKVIVLMTDGINTLAPSYNSDGSTALYTISSPSRQAAVDNTLKKLCSNVKKDGIIIYTVAFAVTDANIKSILGSCASDKTKYFDAADSEGLTNAFAQIGETLQRLRIAK